MRRIAYFTTNKDFKIPEISQDVAIYIFNIKNEKDIEYFLKITDIEEYFIDLTIEELFEKLLI